MSHPAPSASDLLLLTTKLYRPRTRSKTIARQHLLALLEAGRGRPLTLVHAPAGFGKTTLLAEWLNQGSSPAGWLALDERDNAPTTFLRYVIAALQTVKPSVGAGAVLLLNAPQRPPLETLLVPLLNDLAALAEPVVLVLDDYHLISAPEVHQLVRFLLEHQPPSLHLVIASREAPPLPLARLRARGELTELSAADMRFSHAEAAAFLRDVMDVHVSPEIVHAIEARTEGWVAGLQLAALALGRQADQEAFVRDFAGNNRYVVDYLAEEVLGRLPSHLHLFVLRTSILDRMCGPVCDAILGLEAEGPPPMASAPADAQRTEPFALPAYSQLLLEQLERTNLFIVPLDGEQRWYRYHHLFGAVLREQLRLTTPPETVAELHRRACRWFVAEGLGQEAIEHALAARDWVLAAHVLERFVYRFMQRGRLATVAGWLEQFPPEVVQQQPHLLISVALVRGMSSQPETAEPYLQAAERVLAANPAHPQAENLRGKIAGLRRLAAWDRGEVVRAIAYDREALALLSAEAWDWRLVARLMGLREFHVTGEVSRLLEDQLEQLIAAAQVAEHNLVLVGALYTLALVRRLQGRLRDALATFDSVEFIPEQQMERLLLHGQRYRAIYGDMLCEWGRLDEAEAVLSPTVAMMAQMRVAEAEYTRLAFFALARVQQGRGNRAAAAATLETFLNLCQERRYHPALAGGARALLAHLQLLDGDRAGALGWAGAAGLWADDAELPFLRENEYLVLARVLIAQGGGGPADSEALLTRLLAQAEGGGRRHSAISVLVVRALARSALGSQAGAVADVARALALGAPQGYVRVFVDEGAPLVPLLRSAQVHGNHSDHIDTLLAALPAAEAREPGPAPRHASPAPGAGAARAPHPPRSRSAGAPGRGPDQ